jgi:hypothetical protein
MQLEYSCQERRHVRVRGACCPRLDVTSVRTANTRMFGAPSAQTECTGGEALHRGAMRVASVPRSARDLDAVTRGNGNPIRLSTRLTSLLRSPAYFPFSTASPAASRRSPPDPAGSAHPKHVAGSSARRNAADSAVPWNHSGPLRPLRVSTFPTVASGAPVLLISTKSSRQRCRRAGRQTPARWRAPVGIWDSESPVRSCPSSLLCAPASCRRTATCRKVGSYKQVKAKVRRTRYSRIRFKTGKRKTLPGLPPLRNRRSPDPDELPSPARRFDSVYPFPRSR